MTRYDWVLERSPTVILQKRVLMLINLNLVHRCGHLNLQAETLLGVPGNIHVSGKVICFADDLYQILY
jgi:hypothetical protein